MELPIFWNYGVRPSGGRVLVGEDGNQSMQKGKKRGAFDTQHRASESFHQKLYPAQQQPHRTPVDARLEHIVRQLLPRYQDVTCGRWSIPNTIAECNYDMDRTWLTLVWRYSAMMTRERFACDLFKWAPRSTAILGDSDTASQPSRVSAHAAPP